VVTADEIRSRTFLVALRGFDRDEVKAYLSQVADAMSDLEKRLEERPPEPPAPSASVDAPPVAVQEPSPFAEVAAQTQRILEAAQDAAEEIRERARSETERELKQARAQAARIIAEGERRREDIERAVEALTGARADLSEGLRDIGRTIERILRELGPEPAASTVRQALADTAREDAAGAPADSSPPAAPDPEPPEAEPEAEPERGVQRRSEALEALHPKLVRKLKRGLQDLQNATLDALRRNPERANVEPFLPDEDAVHALAALAEEQLDLANAAGIAAGGEAAGTAVSLEPSGRALATQLGSELGGVLLTRLADTLRSGFDAGQGMTALTERVDVVFNRMKSGAAGDVAAVALVRAYEGGKKDAWAASGVTHRRWVRATEPACTDPRCVDNEAAGAVPVGERFPSRHDAPPVRPGCHCSTAPASR
jgi:DivIVA domain-containing protein